jgi:hypothetical protein
MEVIYRGFDGLDVSFAAQIPGELSEELEAAKQHAQEFRQATPIRWNGVRMLVGETGARGGYAFTASTGEFGATWFFKKPNPRDPWGIRVSCNSFNLALNGLGGARADLYRTMERLGIAVGYGCESIGRVDYAVDFLAPDFVLVPDRFVMHSSANRADHIDPPEVRCNGRSGRVTSVTVGKMPGRQVIVYDKRSEVIDHRKVGWWEIWNARRAELGYPPLNAEVAAESRVWRVEVRAGKDHLKDSWSIVRWTDLDSRFGDLITAALGTVRYAQPTPDTNRSRWPESELWQHVHRQAEADLFEMTCRAAPDLVKRVQLDAHLQLLARQMIGLLTTRAALCGVGIDEFEAFARAAGAEMAREIAFAPSRFERKLAVAAGRYDLGLDHVPQADR